jgi:hypothetical protein
MIALSPHPWQRGLAAARANLVPGLILVAAEAILVLAYFFHAPTHDFCGRIGTWKAEYGVLFSALSTGTFGGLIPSLLLRWNPRTRDSLPWKMVPLVIAFWSWRGMEMDLFYRFQGWLFGQGSHWQVVLPKVLVDQFVVSILYFGPVSVLVYRWGDLDYSFRALGRELGWGWAQDRLLPVLLANIGVWTPAITLIYLLPAELQLPVQNVILCFWCLMLAFLAKR